MKRLPCLAVAALLAAGGTAFAHQDRSARITAKLPLKALADGMAFDGSSLWIKTTSDAKLVRIDPVSLRVQARYAVGTPSPGWPGTWAPDEWIATDPKGVWVTDQPSNRLVGIDPRTGSATRHVSLDTPWDVAAGFGSLWVPLFDMNELDRVSERGTIQKRIPIANPSAVAIGAGSIWVIAHRVGKVMRIDPATNRIVATIKLPDHGGWIGGGPERAAFGANAFWASTDGGVARIDARTNTAKHVQVPGQAFATYYVTAGGGAAWVQTPNNVYRVDARTLRVTTALHLQHADCSLDRKTPCVGALTFAADHLWVVDNGARQLLRVTPGKG